MNNYNQASKYENLIKRSLITPGAASHILKISAYRQLFSPLRKPNHYVKDFLFLKGCLLQSIQRFQKRNLPVSAKRSLSDLITVIPILETLEQIDTVIDYLLKLTQTLKNE